MTKAESLAARNDPQDELATLEGGEIKIKAVKSLGSSTLSEAANVAQIIESPAEQLAALMADYPEGEKIEESVQQLIDDYRQNGRFVPSENTPNPERTLHLTGGGEETFEMLVKLGLINQEMADKKQINLAAAIFLRLYRNPDTKQLIVEDNSSKAIKIIQLKSNLASQE
jgi:ribosomal protein L16 Arg81 hydroxylase